MSVAARATAQLLAVALTLVTGARAAPPNAPATRIARAEPSERSTQASQDSAFVPSERTAPAQRDAAMQAYLQRRAARMPGISCDPDGPVYLVLEADTPRNAPPSRDHADFLVHFGRGDEPDEVRVERSSGNFDIDARIARTVCDLLKARSSDGRPANGELGWAHLSIRLRGSDD